MILERPRSAASPLLDPQEIAQSGLMPQLGMVTRALWESPVRNALLRLGAAMFLVIAATAYGQIRLNSWNQPFYDALSRRNYPQFLVQLGVFGIIAGSLLALNVGQRWLAEMLKLRLRDGLAHDLVGNWLKPGRAFRLASSGPIGVNPDQRMHDDARHLTELSTDLGVGLLQASILLVTFISVLWRISSDFVFDLAGRSFPLPGYMVWAAVVYSGSASMLSYWVGRSLVERNADRYAREADLRFSLVRINEHIDAIALTSGEADEARHIETDIAGVLQALRRLVKGLTNLTWITAGYGWFTLVAPILVAAPLYFAGTLTFGGLMMASGAFIQVQSSLRWFVDNFSSIADWRATLLRVASFRRALLNTDVVRGTQDRISIEDGPPGRFTIENLRIDYSTGCTSLNEPRIDLRAGERLHILGASGAGKTLLFRSLAGLWPWGSGRIIHPAREEMLYLPRASYIPPGTLREVLAYPSRPESFDAAAFEPALARLNLSRLAPLLDLARSWDRVLGEDEQQCLGFVRALIHLPAWILMDDVLGILDPPTRDRVVEVLGNELRGTGIIYIGRDPGIENFFGRTVRLVREPDGHWPAAGVAREAAAPPPVPGPA